MSTTFTYKVISSSTNATFKDFLSLTTGKGLKKSDLFIISGQKIIHEFLQNPNHEIVYELMTDKMSSLFDYSNNSLLDQKNTYVLTPELFKELDIIGTHSNLLICRQKQISETNLQDEAQGLELLLPLGDPNNLGAVIRSAYAFGVKKMVLLKESCHPYHPKVIKSSSGASLKCEFVAGPSISELSDNKNIFALDQNGQDISHLTWPRHLRLLVGEEGKGLPSGKFQRLSIPIHSDVESLNATVAASIAMYEWSKKT